jgi:RAB protein geranylgeranyltransferase component A
MTIPAQSDILIEGVNPANLALAVLLSKNGANVLLVDQNPTIGNLEPITLDHYCFDFLIAYGFEFSES